VEGFGTTVAVLMHERRRKQGRMADMRTRSSRKVALACVAVAAALGVVAMPGTAQAASVSPKQDRAMIRVADLSNHYGHVTRSYTEDLGKGRRPTACENPVDGRLATPSKAARSALLKEIAYPANIVWQNTAFYYPTPADAAAAFVEMSREAVKYCNLSKVVNIGTDGDKVKARVTYASKQLAPAGGVPRLAISYGTSLVSAAAPSASYADSYDYSVYALKGAVITRVGVVQVSPNAPIEKSDAESTALKVADRLAKLSG
jgi:hypothetical protein